MIDKTDDLIEALDNYDFDSAYKILQDYWIDIISWGGKKTNINFDKMMIREYRLSDDPTPRKKSCTITEIISGKTFINDFRVREIETDIDRVIFTDYQKTELLFLITKCLQAEMSNKDSLIGKISAYIVQKEILC